MNFGWNETKPAYVGIFIITGGGGGGGGGGCTGGGDARLKTQAFLGGLVVCM